MNRRSYSARELCSMFSVHNECEAVCDEPPNPIISHRRVACARLYSFMVGHERQSVMFFEDIDELDNYGR